MYDAISTRRRHGFQSTALGSGASSKSSAQEKPPPLWVRSQGSSIERCGCSWFPGRRKRKLWAILPFAASAWKQERAWHRPGDSTPEWRRCFRAIPPPLRCAPSRSHAPLLSVSRTKEWQKKPWGFSPWRSVTIIISCAVYPIFRDVLLYFSPLYALTLTINSSFVRWQS